MNTTQITLNGSNGTVVTYGPALDSRITAVSDVAGKTIVCRNAKAAREIGAELAAWGVNMKTVWVGTKYC